MRSTHPLHTHCKQRVGGNLPTLPVHPTTPDYPVQYWAHSRCSQVLTHSALQRLKLGWALVSGTSKWQLVTWQVVFGDSQKNYRHWVPAVSGSCWFSGYGSQLPVWWPKCGPQASIIGHHLAIWIRIYSLTRSPGDMHANKIVRSTGFQDPGSAGFICYGTPQGFILWWGGVGKLIQVHMDWAKTPKKRYIW